MDERQRTTGLQRIEHALAASGVLIACLRLRNAIKYNPYWFLQPRAPVGSPGGIGGQWLAGLIEAGLPALGLVAPFARAVLREAIRRTLPYLRRAPKPWNLGDVFPDDDAFDEGTQRVGPETPRRPEHPVVRFRNERELREYLGPAGPGREWHHIVEKRLANKGSFPPEQIHSTDNIINVPVEVHRRISARMSRIEPPGSNSPPLRFQIESLPFKEQYNLGIEMIKDAYEELGYDLRSIR